MRTSYPWVPVGLHPLSWAISRSHIYGCWPYQILTRPPPSLAQFTLPWAITSAMTHGFRIVGVPALKSLALHPRDNSTNQDAQRCTKHFEKHSKILRRIVQSPSEQGPHVSRRRVLLCSHKTPSMLHAEVKYVMSTTVIEACT